MTTPDYKEVRTIIKFCSNLGKTLTQTMQMLDESKQRHNVSRSLIFKWHKLFSDGRDSVDDDEGRGRKSLINATSVTS